MDPITLEVINSSLLAYADEMTNNFWRTSYSFMNYEIRDYAVGFIDHEGGIMTQSQFTHPAFTADLGFVVKAAIETIGNEGLEEGDIIATNDPVAQGQHLNNVVVFTPLIVKGKVFGFPCIRAHLQDVGGSFIGSGAPNSTEIFQEGIQLNAVKVYKKGVPNADILRVIESNTRFPELVMGDLNAQIAVTKLGLRRLKELVGKYGENEVREAVRTYWDMSETAARKAVATIPDGKYSAESFLDNNGVDSNAVVPIKVRVVVDGEEMTIDHTDTSDQVTGSLNSGYFGGAINVSRIAFKCLTTPHLPSNEGCFRPVKVICPEGKLLNARSPAAMHEWSVPFPTIIDTIFKALSGAIPDRIPGATRGDARGAAVNGFDPVKRKYFSVHIPHIGGHGARPRADGPAPKCAIQQGDEHSMPIEVNETKYPIRFEKYELRANSGGAGKFRGGLGIDCIASLTTDGRLRNMMIRSKCLPWGVQGGKEGGGNVAYLVETDGRQVAVDRTQELPIKSGMRIRVMTGGGGGYGDPLERPPEIVRQDVKGGYISAESAERDYGVILKLPELEVDLEKTRQRRADMARGRRA